MSSLEAILIGMVLAGLSGLPGLGLGRRSAWGQRLAAAVLLAAAGCGLAGAGRALLSGDSVALALPWPLMGQGGAVLLGLDALSAFFLVPVFLMGALGAIYGLGYWPQARHPENGRRVMLFWGLLVFGMALLLVARHALPFLLGWEAMALSAFFLIGTEDRQPEVRWASWLYLIATHVGTLSLFAMFALLRVAGGSFALHPLHVGDAGLGLLSAIFGLALLGFGLKAGLVPLHFWLPLAHASAPSHVSAFLSGVLIKMGIYGLVRICGYLPQPPVAWGALLLFLGAASGILGVLFAIGQHDLKRLLAYHSVENIGIIVMGLGLAMIGRAVGRLDWVLLGLAGGLLHVWNHGLFKALLFLGAGSVVHATGTREIDRLGGLAKTMPATAALFLLGAVAICGLPPLNGFVSELLVYLGLLRTAGIGEGPSWAGAALAVPALALIGALATACFVKVYGAVFLGLGRSPAAAGAHEAPAVMLLPMGVLAAACVLIGLAPLLVAPLLDGVLRCWTPEVPVLPWPLAALAPLVWVSILGLLLVGLAALGWWWVVGGFAARSVGRAGTWDCGYAQPTARMQYTASSLGDFLVGLFRWVLRPQAQRPHLQGPFPKPALFHSRVDDLVLDARLLPAAQTMEKWMARLRHVQQGLVQSYLLYILVTVLAMMVWIMPWAQIIGHLFAR